MAVTRADRSIGVRQTWKNVTGSRALETTYTNTKGRSIAVCVQVACISAAGTSALMTVGGVSLMGSNMPLDGSKGGVLAVVPPGATYVCNTLLATLENWFELD